MRTVYIETSIVSYLTARPSSDLLVAAWQSATARWWDTRRRKFDLYTSQVVIEECGEGNPGAAARRLEVLASLPHLAITDDVVRLARVLLDEGAMPPKATNDAMHVALAAVHAVDYLLTWNCRHIANAETKPLIRILCEDNGYPCPEICTPIELMGG